MISTLLDRLFQRSNVPSGAQVKQRLKFILAHDRAAIEPKVFENMRYEIMRVVSKYVELDEGSLDIRLESDKRMTALIANLPIRMVREDMPDLEALFDEPIEELSLEDHSTQTNSSALEMDQSADAALDAIAAKEIIKSKSTSENIAVVSEPATATERIVLVTEPNINLDDGIENSFKEDDNKELNELPSDQLELSLELPHVSESQEVVSYESQEVVSYESQEIFNQTHE